LPTRARVSARSETTHRHDLLARQAGQRQVAAQPSPQPGQRLPERDQAHELAAIAEDAPARVVAILLAPPRVAAGRLQVTARIAADPHLGVGRRHRQRADARQLCGVADPCAVGIEVDEARPAAPAADTGRVVAHVDQAGLARDGGLVLGGPVLRRAAGRLAVTPAGRHARSVPGRR